MYNKLRSNKFLNAILLCTVLCLKASGQQSIENFLKCSYKENSKTLLATAENAFEIPQHLLMAIAYVESKWHPWAVNAKGRAFYFDSKADAVKFVKKLQLERVKNIGVGYMQINLSIHGNQFSSLEDAFDPEQNVAYAAKLMTSLFKRFSSWEKAVKYYHTATKKYNVPYRNRVYKTWSKIKETVVS